MKLSQAKEYLPFVQALAEGKEVEIYIPNHGWRTIGHGHCDLFMDSAELAGYKYRIKPEPKLRPWKPEEVPVGAWFRTKLADVWGIIQWFDRRTGELKFAECTYKLDVCFRACEHSLDHGKSWKPCGVLE